MMTQSDLQYYKKRQTKSTSIAQIGSQTSYQIEHQSLRLGHKRHTKWNNNRTDWGTFFIPNRTSVAQIGSHSVPERRNIRG